MILLVYLAIAAGFLIWRSVSWFRAYDRHYPLGWSIIARQWAGLTVRAAAWPLVAIGALVGDVIDGARWVWNHRPRRNPKLRWDITTVYEGWFFRNFNLVALGRRETDFTAAQALGIEVGDVHPAELDFYAKKIVVTPKGKRRWFATVEYGRKRMREAVDLPPAKPEPTDVCPGCDKTFKLSEFRGKVNCPECRSTPSCCRCGKRATRIERGDPIDVTTVADYSRKFFQPTTGWCDEHDPLKKTITFNTNPARTAYVCGDFGGRA